jgi:hypothetical protein
MLPATTINEEYDIIIAGGAPSFLSYLSLLVEGIYASQAELLDVSSRAVSR